MKSVFPEMPGCNIQPGLVMIKPERLNVAVGDWIYSPTSPPLYQEAYQDAMWELAMFGDKTAMTAIAWFSALMYSANSDKGIDL